jgi:hypothetical protein
MNHININYIGSEEIFAYFYNCNFEVMVKSDTFSFVFVRVADSDPYRSVFI